MELIYIALFIAGGASLWYMFKPTSPKLVNSSKSNWQDVNKEAIALAYDAKKGGYQWGRYEQPIVNPNILVKSCFGGIYKIIIIIIIN